jgi:hypothetical protein
MTNETTGASGVDRRAFLRGSAVAATGAAAVGGVAAARKDAVPKGPPGARRRRGPTNTTPASTSRASITPKAIPAMARGRRRRSESFAKACR